MSARTPGTAPAWLGGRSRRRGIAQRGTVGATSGAAASPASSDFWVTRAGVVSPSLSWDRGGLLHSAGALGWVIHLEPFHLPRASLFDETEPEVGPLIGECRGAVELCLL